MVCCFLANWIYDETVVNKVFEIIAKKRTDNPQRNILYTTGIIKKLGEKGKAS